MSTTSRGDKGEAKVIELLNQIKDYKYIINNFTLINPKNKSTHQIDHILIHPHGIFVIETKNYYGTIIGSNNGELWHKNINGKDIVIANPIAQNKSHCYYVSKALNNKYEPISLIVYVKNNAPYFDDENVINIKELLLFIDSFPYKSLLSKKEIDEIYHKLISKNINISKDEHIQNVKHVKEKKEQIRNQMSYAIEEGKCPICNSKIINRGCTYKCSKCSYKFSL